MHGAISVPGCRINGRIARGGMGWVFEGTHLGMDLPVAIKLLHPRAAKNAEKLARFEDEARLAARINSRHCVRMLDAGATDDGGRFIVMDFIDGDSLESELFEFGRLPTKTVCVWGAQLATGIADMHAAGVLHRDIKPSNVMVSSRHKGPGRCVLIDFGIAISLDEEAPSSIDGAVWGTPRFMAPEQARGRELGPASDVYSFGVALYEMVSGRLPFTMRQSQEVMRAHVQQDPPPVREHTPQCAAPVADLIERCLAKQPCERPSAAELAGALRALSQRADLEERVEVWRATA